MWGFSSAGRAPALQAGGQRFDPANLHHTKLAISDCKEARVKEILRNGIERRLLAIFRWHIATAVAFPQKSDPANLHHTFLVRSENTAHHETGQ